MELQGQLHQHNDQQEEHWHNLFDLRPKGNASVNTLGNEEVDAERRRNQTERQVHHHDHTELNGIVVERADEREKDRGVNVGRSCGLHKAAVDQQDHVDDKQDQEDQT